MTNIQCTIHTVEIEISYSEPEKMLRSNYLCPLVHFFASLIMVLPSAEDVNIVTECFFNNMNQEPHISLVHCPS